MSEEGESHVEQSPDAVTLPEFLEGIPPSQITAVSEVAKPLISGMGMIYAYEFLTPEIQLHCADEACNGTRFFRCTTSPPNIPHENYKFFYVTYLCSNCRRQEKTFSLAVQCDKDSTSGKCYKFGELPMYGPPTSARLIKLIGPDRETFLKGRRCENQGLGVGAFVYYRRVVENQKNRILDEIIKVSNKIGADADLIAALEDAKQETQFSKALASVKDAMPQALLINGHNPLTLLYSALSDGLHDQTDEHCLDIASSVRVVLGELSERLSQALKDEAELNNALGKLMYVKAKG